MRPASPITGIHCLDFPKQYQTDYKWLKAKAPRYYTIEDEIGKGAFGTAYRSYACDKNGKRQSEIALVVKLPIIQREQRTDEEIMQRLGDIRRKNIQDFFHIGARLRGSPHANPVIDLASYIVDSTFEVHATIQPFLDNAFDLDTWLERTGLIKQPVDRDTKNRSIRNGHNFLGLKDRKHWAKTSLRIARGLEDLHNRRVTHGDVHPGNVFLGLEEHSLVKFIDFGEAFLATPGRQSRKRNAHAYLAPERLGPRFLLNEQVDVYSFGILMLYLATGIEHQLCANERPGGYRSIIATYIRERNPQLLETTEPRILDVIGRCVSRDPADRPRMGDVCDTLDAIAETPTQAVRGSRKSRTTILGEISKCLENARATQSPVIVQLLEQQIRDLKRTFQGLETEMVELVGTRDQMLRIMVSLFDSLKEGDSWTAATTLGLWQRSALGLDGSYSSANIRATQRGASIRRVFVVSVEELGVTFCSTFKSRCLLSTTPAVQTLGKRLDTAIATYRTRPSYSQRQKPHQSVIAWHQQRLLYVLTSLAQTIADWGLKGHIHERPRNTSSYITDLRGLFYGLYPVPTLDEVGEVREDNPASLMHLASESDPKRQWLLVTTEARGRRASPHEMEKPHLVGVRVFKSRQGELNDDGKPHDRIRLLNDLLTKHSVDITAVAAELVAIVQKSVPRAKPKSDSGKQR